MHGRDETEDVRRRSHAEFVQPLVRRFQERGEEIGLGHPVRCRKDLCRKALVRLRKADVIELDLVEAEMHQLLGDTNVVIP